MNTLDKLGRSGIIPVVVIDDAKNAVPTANALLKGGIDVMEITFRTAAAADAIRAVSESCPNMTVGAGTIITLTQCKKAVAAGAKFIVSPGFDEETVKWCIENRITITPGCVTPSEIMAAMRYGIQVVKFFPASVYGGLNGLKALSAPFSGIKFIPTGGVNVQNIGGLMAAPFVYAAGGSWICTKKDISEGNFEKITALCKEAKQAALGYEVAHIGINCADEKASSSVCEELSRAFGFTVKEGSSSNFSSTAIEIMKANYLGSNGHIAIYTNRIGLAVVDLEEKGYCIDMNTAKYKGETLVAVYLKHEIGSFAIHLLQK